MQEVTNTPVTDSSGGNYIKSIIPIADMFRKGYICPAAMSKDILFKVEYTAERDKLYPKLLTTNGDSFTIALGELGKYKNTHWAFQKEWRYILIFLPLNLNTAFISSFFPPDIAYSSNNPLAFVISTG